MSEAARQLATPTRSGLLGVLVIVASVVVAVHSAVLTDGFRVSLLEPDGPCQYFDAQADALSSGRLDVDPYHIGNEAFLFDDVAYGYFGMTPALLRMPLHALLPSLWGRWARVLILLAMLVTVLAAHALAADLPGAHPAMSRERRVAHGLYLALIGLGSTSLFLSSRPNVYHEASALGTALTLSGFAALAAWLRGPTLLRAALTACFCLVALHARFVVGVGLVLAVALVVVLTLLRRCSSPLRSLTLWFDAPNLHALVLALGVLIGSASYISVNSIKFGTLVALPLEHHLQVTPERLARAGAMMSARNLAANAYNYLMPWNVRFGAKWPSVRPVPPHELVVTPGMDYDWREPVIALSVASPALLGMSVFGLALMLAPARRRAFWPFIPLMLGGAAAAAAPLAYHGISQRYGHDMLSFLAVSSALGFAAITRASSARVRCWLGVLALGAAWSMFVWLQIAAHYREWGRDIRIWPVRDDVIVPAYERELAMHPNNLTLHFELAHIHGQNGRPEQARVHLERALELDPRHEPALLLLAALRQRADPAGSLELLRRAAGVSPRAVETRRMLAMLLLTHGQPQAAIEQLRLVTELDPADRSARELLARVQARAERDAAGLAPPNQ
jgi:tetratricopeptide (TPR) repeat protein